MEKHKPKLSAVYVKPIGGDEFLELSKLPRWQICQYCGKHFQIARRRRAFCTDSHMPMASRERAEQIEAINSLLVR